MNRQQALEDLFFAVKKHLLDRGRNLSTSIMIATKVVEDAEKLNADIEDINVMRDVFLAQEVIIMFWNFFIATMFFIGVVTTLSLLTAVLVYIGGQHDQWYGNYNYLSYRI